MKPLVMQALDIGGTVLLGLLCATVFVALAPFFILYIIVSNFTEWYQ